MNAGRNRCAMSATGFNPALRKKLQAANGSASRAVLRPDDLSGALLRSLRLAAAPFEGLHAEPAPQDPVWDISLTDAKDALPDHRLLAVLESDSDARALCVLENEVVDALVEVQTTGTVGQGPGLVRETTQIDAALTRDFIGLFLSAFAKEFGAQAGVNWPLGLTYGTHLTDDRQLDLLFVDRPYHLLKVQLTLGEGAKSGMLLLLLPVTGQDQMQPDCTSESGADDWSRYWPAILADAPVVLEAVLFRETMALSRVQELVIGDVLYFDRADLAQMRVMDVAGAPVFRARLGRKTGKRALCLMPGLGLPVAIVPSAEKPNPAPDPAPKKPERSLIEAAMP